jgi:glycosyltransferase involved in cell wall biosynthesis
MTRQSLPRISVILVTYEWPDALDRVLFSLSKQLVFPHEIIVADDGSGPETRDCVERWRTLLPFSLHYVRQEDRGFRAAEARNRGVALSSGDYLLFLDGDCLVFKDFIARHQQLAEPHWQVVGNRVLLNPHSTQLVLTQAINPLVWDWRAFLKARRKGWMNRLLPLFRLGDGRWRKHRSRKWRGAQSCNLGIWRDDFFAVNGFDEAFQGWGHEDADLVARLIAHGCLRKDGHFAVPVLHLWHKENSRELNAKNIQRLEQTLGGELPSLAEKGVNQHLKKV